MPEVSHPRPTATNLESCSCPRLKGADPSTEKSNAGGSERSTSLVGQSSVEDESFGWWKVSEA